MKLQSLVIATVVCTCGVAWAQNAGSNNASLTKMAATMNELAVACDHMSVAEIQKAKTQQREAVVSGGMTAAQYDAAYSSGVADFAQRWNSISKDDQARQCAQIKAMSDQSAAQAKALADKAAAPRK